jgi:hypothetical protein
MHEVLTPRQEQLVRFVCRYARERGRPPTMPEIAEHMHCTPAVALRLAYLAEAAGRLRHKPRTHGTWTAVDDKPAAGRARRAKR